MTTATSVRREIQHADLIGCPFRITGEKNPTRGGGKRRGDSESKLVALAEVASAIRAA
jgi:hypothetical protein